MLLGVIRHLLPCILLPLPLPLTAAACFGRSNPPFMAAECAQSCGVCDAVKFPARPLIGAPGVTCRDDGSGEGGTAGGCVSLAALGACDSQRAHMQEHCRRTCAFCNASKDAFTESGGGGHGKEDTAAHTCPDGSDLGGGEVLVDSKGSEAIAEAAAIDDDQTERRADSAPANVDGQAGDPIPRKELDGTGSNGAAPLVSLAGADTQQRGAASLAASAQPAIALTLGAADGENGSSTAKAAARHSLRNRLVGMDSSLDLGLLSWPFALVQGLCMVGVGYFARGYMDKRSRRRRFQLPSHGL